MTESQQIKTVIIIGAGTSINNGISLNLWENIKNNTIWSCNYAWLTMPYLPTREVFVDKYFFKNNIDALNELVNKNVEVIGKHNFINSNLPKLKTYATTRNIKEYCGKEGIIRNKIFVGQQGFCGTFALHLSICEGYKRIFLLGFDYGVKPEDDSKKTHYYQDKIKVLSHGMGNPRVYKHKNGQVHPGVNDYIIFNNEEDVKIYNVSPDSNINAFEKITYEQMFELLRIENDTTIS